MQYYFKDGEEHPIAFARHGNSKKTTQDYIRTWESTKYLLEKVSRNKKPRDAVHKVVSDDLGGVASCAGVGQLPRNRQQASDLKRNRERTQQPNSSTQKNMSGPGRADDPWYLLLNASKQHSLNKETAFVRDVRVGGEPLCVLASNRQLNDLKRFCCNHKEFKPLTVDPTFDIGTFNVTPISYQHLLLETKNEGKHPTLIGPVLISEKKTEETYSTFCSSFKSLELGLSNLIAFGTDDEKALENAFNLNFERSVHLLCEIHLKKNIERKLIALGIQGRTKDNIVSDVFGHRKGEVYEVDLSDAASENDFSQQLAILEKKWKDAHENGHDFYVWFCENKAADFVKSVISPVRQRAGLGCPPERFTTNRSERTNGVIQEFVKRESGREKVDEFTFAVTLQKLVEVQEKEAEFAIVGQGEYNLRECFKHLQIPAARWSKMTEKQMKASLKKVHTTTMDEARPSNVTNISQSLEKNFNPLLRRLVDAKIDWIPQDVLQSIAEKAISLEDSTHPLPGAEIETVIVPSKSTPKKPNVVLFYANGKSECQDCPGYSSQSSLCAHTLAACLKVQRLDEYLKWLLMTQRKTGGINYTKAITHGMPAGRGRKPNEKPRKRTKRSHPSTNDLIVVPKTSLEHSNVVPQVQAEAMIPQFPASLPPSSFVYSHPVQATVSPSQPALSVPHVYDYGSQPEQSPSFCATVSEPLANNHVFPEPVLHIRRLILVPLWFICYVIVRVKL